MSQRAGDGALPSSEAVSTRRIWATSAWRGQPSRRSHLDTVLFAPVGIQPLKPHGATASFDDRVAMTELAIKGLPQFAISLADAPDATGKPNYTIDTLMRLRQEYPSAKVFYSDGRRLSCRASPLVSGRRDSLRGSADRCIPAGTAARRSGRDPAGGADYPRR